MADSYSNKPLQSHHINQSDFNLFFLGNSGGEDNLPPTQIGGQALVPPPGFELWCGGSQPVVFTNPTSISDIGFEFPSKCQRVQCSNFSRHAYTPTQPLPALHIMSAAPIRGPTCTEHIIPSHTKPMPLVTITKATSMKL
jgi:hypothetical protein